MTTLARSSVGRVLLHLLAMLGDRCVRFQTAGIMRALPLAAAALTLPAQMRNRLISAVVLYLARPTKHHRPATTADPQPLAAILHAGDVLLSEGNTRVAALVKRVTRSPWSHVSMYVGPLEDGPDPRCIVEADLAAGVRSIRLSEVRALQVRVLRPIGLNADDQGQLTAWVISRIGSEYDLAHAWILGLNLLRPPARTHFRSSPSVTDNSSTRYICCSLLARAFALVGCPISPIPTRLSVAMSDPRTLVPGDFERATVFESIGPINNGR